MKQTTETAPQPTAGQPAPSRKASRVRRLSATLGMF
jgi:hypothetical protein